MNPRKPSTQQFRAIRGLLAGVPLILATLPCLGQTVSVPAELSFLSKAPLQAYRITAQPWNQMELPPGHMVSGKYFEAPIIVSDGKGSDVSWPIVKAAFLANGWTILTEHAAGYSAYVHYQKNGVEAWAAIEAGDYQRGHVTMVEAAPMPVSLTLTPPAATPELVVAEKGDYPYLSPIPGTTFASGKLDPAPFYVTPKGGSAELVASGSMLKGYRFPGDMSNAMFQILYKDALVKAGWTIVNEFKGADVSVTAHYAKNGRNIWAVLHKNSDGYDLQVADAGAAQSALGADLAKNCHVALYGVLFDFNKSTLQPASDPVLQKILDLLTKDSTLHLEIQGHTDNVGGDAYNQTLSEARAKAVAGWLAQHGVAAARLTSKGYGKTVPIADNSTDAGRAKNRRVEIADPRCAAKRE